MFFTAEQTLCIVVLCDIPAAVMTGRFRKWATERDAELARQARTNDATCMPALRRCAAGAGARIEWPDIGREGDMRITTRVELLFHRIGILLAVSVTVTQCINGIETID
jgi:hypothetical protein